MAKIVEHQMKFRVEMMTPTWAQELLDNNHPQNRSPKKHKIEQYTRDMMQGFWRLTPEPICIDLDGWTINGQNRLTAVVRSGCDVPMTVVTGCPTQALLGMDQGSSRNFADYVKIGNRKTSGTGGACNIAGVVRAIHRGITSSKMNLTNAEVITLAENHSEALDFCFACLPKNIRGITQAPVRAVIARAYYKRNFRNRTRLFCTMLMDGLVENAKTDSGVIRLRNWLQDNFLGGARRARAVIRCSPIMVYAKTERALEAFHDEEFIQQLNERKSELFPLPDESPEELSELNGVTVN